MAQSAAGNPSSGRASERLRTIATVLSPLAVGTVLLYYFGWVRTKVQATALGYDAQILDLSTADYLLKSVNVLSIPLIIVLIISLILYQLHQRLLTSTSESMRARMATLLSQSWLSWLPICVALMVFVPPLAPIAIPSTLTMALLGAIYGDILRRNIVRQQRWASTTRVIVAILLALTLFWDTERLARAMGEGFAANIAANPQQLVTVTIYSAKSLQLPPDQVVETKIGGPDSAYHYQYTGLRLLQRSGNKYLMLNDGWNPSIGRVFVINDSNDLRMEFTHGL